MQILNFSVFIGACHVETTWVQFSTWVWQGFGGSSPKNFTPNLHHSPIRRPPLGTLKLTPHRRSAFSRDHRMSEFDSRNPPVRDPTCFHFLAHFLLISCAGSPSMRFVCVDVCKVRNYAPIFGTQLDARAAAALWRRWERKLKVRKLWRENPRRTATWASPISKSICNQDLRTGSRGTQFRAGAKSICLGRLMGFWRTRWGALQENRSLGLGPRGPLHPVRRARIVTGNWVYCGLVGYVSCVGLMGVEPWINLNCKGDIFFIFFTDDLKIVLQ